MTCEGKGRVTFLDEYGTECDLEHLATIEFHGKEYAVFVSCDETDRDEQEVIILQILVDDEGEEAYCTVEDDISEGVFNIFRSVYAEEYNFN
jgi:uncharacterized protein YrzB (UPF0473 family)